MFLTPLEGVSWGSLRNLYSGFVKPKSKIQLCEGQCCEHEVNFQQFLPQKFSSSRFLVGKPLRICTPYKSEIHKAYVGWKHVHTKYPAHYSNIDSALRFTITGDLFFWHQWVFIARNLHQMQQFLRSLHRGPWLPTNHAKFQRHGEIDGAWKRAEGTDEAWMCSDRYRQKD